jgi:hypothetical protein
MRKGGRFLTLPSHLTVKEEQAWLQANDPARVPRSRKGEVALKGSKMGT